MKKNTVIFFLFILSGFSVYAQKQKVTIEDDTIKIDGKNYAIIEKKGGMGMQFSVKSLDGKEQIFFNMLEFNDPQERNSSNPQGRVTYFEVTFMNSGGRCEVMGVGKKGLAKMVVENNLIKDNSVDADAEKRFIMINGTKYSERKKVLDSPDIIIIQNH